ncbi:hypothetical protein CEUSTIGMA_g4959.t1 [Chlamydomonas eustigma]|uniref:Uncharacterized protein n=1 Tax=Chlamydomonas eustigma TaxID=1157962 RepID=A0A250X380_9CHLO|nr:hypothetical protein CEUSTIGMA_g4959.t1 [Chlamydomonas eustigma]|eukprot:GAX77515.1 hypothetical protein CEUSTIGMA_g4959.t1 [Chlamydomonas eustigma]
MCETMYVQMCGFKSSCEPSRKLSGLCVHVLTTLGSDIAQPVRDCPGPRHRPSYCCAAEVREVVELQAGIMKSAKMKDQSYALGVERYCFYISVLKDAGDILAQDSVALCLAARHELKTLRRAELVPLTDHALRNESIYDRLLRRKAAASDVFFGMNKNRFDHGRVGCDLREEVLTSYLPTKAEKVGRGHPDGGNDEGPAVNFKVSLGPTALEDFSSGAGSCPQSIRNVVVVFISSNIIGSAAVGAAIRVVKAPAESPSNRIPAQP